MNILPCRWTVVCRPQFHPQKLLPAQAVLILVGTFAATAASFGTNVAIKAVPFRLDDVRMLDPALNTARDLDRKYLLEFDLDRLLHNFRVNAGLPSTAKPLADRESPSNGWRGHYTGHFLSACALMYASTGDTRLKDRAGALVAELAKCQAKLGDKGYLSAFPESSFDDLENGRPVAVIWYALHKIMAGLLDVHEYCGNTQALGVLERMAAWVDWRTGRLTQDQMQQALRVEFGGMNDLLANLAAATGKRHYLEVAQRFDHHAVFDPAAQGRDTLTGLHANTQIPKFIGAACEYELTGDAYYHDAAEFFWRQIALHRSYATGGNSENEHFRTPPDVLASTLSRTTQETCNTYNMLKLTRHLFGWEPEAVYADFYERALINHILATPHPTNGVPLYYLGLQPGQWKVHFLPNECYYCCVGSGLENFAKLGDSIYFHSERDLWVNLFFASEVNWKDKGVTLRQETRFPEQAGTRVTIRAPHAVAFRLNVRIPYWAAGAKISVNGTSFTPEKALTPASYAAIERTWRDGDRVEVALPMKLHLQRMPDDPNLAAIMYGPLVLAGELGGKDITPEKVFIREKVPRGGFPAVSVLNLIGTTDVLEDWIRPVPGRPLTFRTRGVGQPEDVTLSPLYRLFDQRYNVYWRLAGTADRQKSTEAEAE